MGKQGGGRASLPFQSAFPGVGRTQGQARQEERLGLKIYDSATIPQPGLRWSQAEEGEGKERAGAYH